MSRPLASTLGPIPSNGLLLHVGVHKTGTTALQAALADARADLATYGVCYPGRGTDHNPAGKAALGVAGSDPAGFDRLLREVRRHAGRVVVSSEALCVAPPETVDMVVSGLGRQRVHVVVTLRSVASLLPSSYQESLKNGHGWSFETWLKDVFSVGDRATTLWHFWRRHDHGEVVARWAAAVGAANVTVLVLEGAPPVTVFAAFARLLDLPEEVLVSRMGLASNRSMTAQEAELLRRVNVAVRDQFPRGEYDQLMRHGMVRALVEGREPGPGELRLRTPDWALDGAAARGAAAAAQIGDLGVRVVGDLNLLGLRPATLPEYPPGALESAPMSAAVHAIASLLLEAKASSVRRDLRTRAARRIRAHVPPGLRARLRT